MRKLLSNLFFTTVQCGVEKLLKKKQYSGFENSISQVAAVALKQCALVADFGSFDHLFQVSLLVCCLSFYKYCSSKLSVVWGGHLNTKLEVTAKKKMLKTRSSGYGISPLLEISCLGMFLSKPALRPYPADTRLFLLHLYFQEQNKKFFIIFK